MTVVSKSFLLEPFRLIPMEARVWSPALAADFKERLEKAGYPVLSVDFDADPRWPAAMIQLVEIDRHTGDPWLIIIPVIHAGMTRCQKCGQLPCGELT